MYEIKQLKNSDIYTILPLYEKLARSTMGATNAFSSTNMFIIEVGVPGSLILGLFRESDVVGIILGRPNTEIEFDFTIMYVETNSRIKVKDFLVEAEALILSYGFTRWTAKAVTKEGSKMLDKYIRG